MQNTLEVCLVILGVVLPLSFLYWRVFRPVLITRLRYRMFQSRDELRLMAFKGEVGEKDKAYSLLERFVNRCLAHMHHVDLADIIAARPNKAEELEAKRDLQMIAEAQPQYRKIFTRVMLASIGAVFANSPGFILIGGILAVPVLALFILSFWFARVKNAFVALLARVWGFLNTQPSQPAYAG